MKRVLALIAWMACTAPAWSVGGAEGDLLDTYTVRLWTVEDGLPERGVRAVAPGPDGYLWVATDRHVLRFDGIRFVEAGSPSPEFDAAADEHIFRMLVTDERTAYVLTSEALRCWDGDGWHTVARPDPERGDDWQDATLTCDTRGTVVLGSRTRIAAFANGVEVEPASDRPLDATWTLRGGIPHECVAGEFEPRPLSDDSDDKDQASWLSVTDGSPTVMTATGVHARRRGAWERVADRPDIATCVIVDRSGGVWCGGERGIRLFRDGTWSTIDNGRAPVNVSTTSLVEDPEGNVWAGTDGGLVRFRQRTQGVRVVRASQQAAGVRAAWQADDGAIWATPDRGGVVRLASGNSSATFEPVGFLGEAAGLRFEAILVAADGHVWLGTDGASLWHGYPGKTLRSIAPARADRRMAVISSLAFDPRGGLWIGSGAGLFRLPAGRGEPLLAPEPNTNRRAVEEIFPDIDGTLWIGRQDDPIVQIDADGFVCRNLADAVPAGSYWSFHRDRRGTLWAGGDGRLVCLADPIIVYEPRHGLPDAAITQIEDTPSGMLWLGTRDGLFAGDLERIDRLTSRKGGLFRRFDADGPLAHVNCTGRINKRRGSGGRLAFPTAQGLVLLDSTAGVARSATPRAMIEEVTVRERGGSARTLSADEVAVPPDARDITARFTAIHMANPEALRFRYRVTDPAARPSDEDGWVSVGRERQVVIRGLPPGRHTFEVRARTNGSYATEGSAVTFTVEPLYWQRPAFVIASGAALAGCLAALSTLVLRSRYRRKLAREVALQRERERIARDIHDDLGAGLTHVAHLSAMAADHDTGDEPSRQLFQRICAATTGLARSLDEIVWAVNPANDSLDKLISYLAEFAQEFASAAGVACRLDLPRDVPHRAVPSRVRHHVCMLLKESLHNAVHHGQPKGVMVGLRMDGRTLTMTVSDDGRGFDRDQLPFDDSGRRSGITAMHHRVDELGGRLMIESLRGTGTTVEIAVEV